MAKQQENKLLFEEQQRFRQVWLWVLIGAVAALFWIGFIWQVVLGNQFGNRPAPNVLLTVMAVLVGVGFPVFFYYIKLKTRVYENEVWVRMVPFHLNWVKIPFQKVKTAEQVTYNPILDYGGWGIRWGFKGKAYNMSGDQGVKLHFFQHKPLLIGTQKPEQLLAAIEKGLKKRDERFS